MAPGLGSQLRMRLARHGRTHRPFYRLVVADSRAPRDGKHIEVVGTYNPLPDREGKRHVRLDKEKIEYWIAQGAAPSDKVAYLLGRSGILPASPQRYSAVTMVPKKERQSA